MTGAENYVDCLSREFATKGHRITVVSEQWHSQGPYAVVLKPMHTARSFWRRRQLAKEIRQLIFQEKVDVVHTHSRAAVRIAHRALLGCRIPMVSTIHGEQHFSWGKRLFPIYGRLIAVCEAAKEQLVNQLKMDPQTITVIRNPVVNSDIESAFHHRQQMQQMQQTRDLQRQAEPASNEHKNNFHLAIIGRRTGPKGHNTRTLITKVLMPALQDYPHLQITVTGGSAQQWGSEFEQWQKNFANRVHFYERIDFNSALKDVHLVVGAGRVAITSLASGVPVLGLGEKRYLGPITLKNWSLALSTNFGDMDQQADDFSSAGLWSKISEDLASAVVNAATPSSATPSPATNANAAGLSAAFSEEQSQLRNETYKEYSVAKIAHAIDKIYQEERCRKGFPKHIPILMYHKVVDQAVNSPHRIFIHKELFAKHLSWFRKWKFTSLTFEQLSQYKSGKLSFWDFPKKPIVLTFDDGYENNLQFAVPELKKQNFVGVFYLLADSSVSTNQWDLDENPNEPQFRLLNPLQRRQLVAEGMEVGSHGFSHRLITEMSFSEAAKEIGASKQQLEAELNTPIRSFAFTYGQRRNDMDEVLRTNGYDFAVNTDSGGLVFYQEPYSLFRINIFPNDGYWQMRKKTARAYRQYYHFKRQK